MFVSSQFKERVDIIFSLNAKAKAIPVAGHRGL
jgi:hypothetical protein